MSEEFELQCFDETSFQAKLNLLAWTPYQVLKIFKVGLHWVTVYRPAIDARNVQYWVKRTWESAILIANEVAAAVRKEFESLYAQPV